MMINKIIEFSLEKRLFIMITLASIIIWGVFSYNQIPIDAFPDVTNNQVQILSSSTGYSPLEMEKLVTYPIEIEMSSLPGLIEKRSISQFGLSAVTLVFDDDIDIYWIRNLILERLIKVKEEMPEGVDVEMGPVSTGLGEIYQYTLKSDSLNPMELRTLQDWVITPALRSVKGVIEVNNFGGKVKQYQILLDQNKMLQYQVSLDDVFESVEQNNNNQGGNFIVKNSEQYVIRSTGMYETKTDIENVVVKLNDDVPVHIYNIASVELKPQVRYGTATQDAEGETVVGIVMMLKGESGRDVVQAVKEKMKTIKTALPKSVDVSVYYDRIELVNAAVYTISEALLIGVILVIVILFIFLNELRPAIVVALVLPFSILMSFIAMKLLGMSANLMSLGGLAIGIGMLVDGTIVVVENIMRHLKDSSEKSLKEKIRIAAVEVGRPSAFAIFVIVVVFLPLLTLEGLEGKMFSPLALTISIALFSSLILAITMAPVLSSFLIKSNQKVKSQSFLEKLEKLYSKFLNFCIYKQKETFTLAIILILFQVFIFTRLGTEFVPTLEEGSIAVQAFRLPSISLDESIRSSKMIEKRILRTPEVTTVVSRTGRAEVANDPMLPSISDIYVMMKPLDQWRDGFSKDDILSEIRENLEEIPGILFSVSQPIALRVDELISGVKSQLAVKIYGDDMDVLNRKASEIESLLSNIDGAVDVKSEQTTGFGYLQIKLNRHQIARYGLNVDEIQEYVSTAIGGKTATKLYEGEKIFDVVVRYQESDRYSIDAIKNILVQTPFDGIVPLYTFAEIYFEEGPAQISREDGKRRVTVELNLKDVDIGTFVENAQQKIENSISLPTGYYLTWGGQFENQQRAMLRLAIILPITLFLVFIFLFTSMGTVRHSILVMLNIPFSILGGVLSLWVTNLYMSVPASVGFIVVIGMAVQNGIVIVSFIKDLRHEHIKNAIFKGALLRLRPILMTAFTTLFGLIPLLLASGIGSEVQRPLAAVVVGGLITSIISTLILLPLLYNRMIKSQFHAAI